MTDMWYKHNDATYHKSHATFDILHERFEEMVFWRKSDANWPTRECDLTSLDGGCSLFIEAH